MKRIFLIALALSLTGCVSMQPQPQLYNGKYYMAGDRDCVRARQTRSQFEDGEISCYNSSNQYTGTRYAMTSQDIQMWSAMKQVEAAQAQARAAQDLANSATRPRTTNCYRIGNSVQCNSY